MAQRGAPPEAFYGLFRLNLPTFLPALLAQHPQVLRRTLESAIRAHLVPASLQGDVDAILDRFQQLIVEHAFETPDQTGKTSVSALLSTIIPSQDLQRKILTAYVRHEGALQEFWQALRADSQVADVVDDLQFTLQSAALTQNHLPLVRELQTMRRQGILTSLRDLARLDAAAWADLINRQIDGRIIGFPPDVPGRDDAEKNLNYAARLERIIEAAFPTAVIADRVSKDNIPGKEDLVKFFSNSQDFEFSSNIDKYLRIRGEAAVVGVTNKEHLTRQLKSMQRVSRLTTRYDEMKVLLADGKDSARSIVRMGRTAFVQKYGDRLGGEAQATTLYANASHTAAMALAVYGQYGEAFHTTAVTKQPLSKQEQQQLTSVGSSETTVIDEIPNWETLFGPPVSCECIHCRSVYSPAAYFVDILKFLGDHASSALAELLNRRADIGNIELSCENTNTPVPYVDLVNEVLENAVAPIAFGLSTAYQSDLDGGQISFSLKEAFKNNGALLSAEATVAIENPGSRWAISDTGWRYHIELQLGQLQVSVAAQTYGKPEELGTDPQFVNQKAYAPLGKAVYPWDLPFDLWAEEARVYLDHLGAPRHRLMEIFYKNASPAELNDTAITSEYLGLTSFEQQIITGGVSQPSWSFWGLGQNVTFPDPADPDNTITETWLEHLTRVPVFLQRSGLSLAELLELWETRFILPEGTISAEPPNSCNLNDFWITALTQEELDRAHRFLRLRRKLGWTIRELDKVLSALQPDQSVALTLTEDLLKQLSHIQRLRAHLKVPLVTMMSWWSRIDTVGYDPEGKSLYAQLFQNKTVVKLTPTEEPGPFALNDDGTELLENYAEDWSKQYVSFCILFCFFFFFFFFCHYFLVQFGLADVRRRLHRLLPLAQQRPLVVPGVQRDPPG